MITSIHKLSLEAFIDCLVDGALDRLGDGTDAERAAAWEDILHQYNEAMGDEQAKRYIQAARSYVLAKERFESAERYIELLNTTYVRQWCDELNRLVGAKFIFGPHDREVYTKQLKNCAMRNAGNKMYYKMEEQKFHALAGVQQKSSTPPDRAYFTKVMINLKDRHSREIPYSISTYEFCTLVNQYMQYVKTMEAQNARR
jgi:hypothetical protein